MPFSDNGRSPRQRLLPFHRFQAALTGPFTEFPPAVFPPTYGSLVTYRQLLLLLTRLYEFIN